MSVFQPEKLSIEYRDGVTEFYPLFERCYTLTHSDSTGKLFLTIGQQFAYDKITSLRDEVLAQWKIFNRREIYLNVYVFIGDFGQEMNEQRFKIFKEKLPLALTAIIYGERKFLRKHSMLLQAPVCIHFDSSEKKYNQLEVWGTVGDYSL